MDITGIASILDLGGRLIDRFVPDPDKANEAKFELFKLEQSGELKKLELELQAAQSQTSVNLKEAEHPNLFVSGWRPFIGWTCGVACAWNWIGISVLNAVCTALQYNVVLKSADINDMYPVLLGLLGLGAMRTYERTNGVHRIK